jgi:dipeptide/tripeptide permease
MLALAQGIVLLTASSLFPCRKDEVGQADPMQYGVLLAALAIISLGTGGIKPNVSAVSG